MIEEDKKHIDEIQEILDGFPPRQLIWGTFSLFIFLIAIILICTQIKSPEILPIRIMGGVSTIKRKNVICGDFSLLKTQVSGIKNGQNVTIKFNRTGRSSSIILKGSIENLNCSIGIESNCSFKLTLLSINSVDSALLKNGTENNAEMIVENQTLLDRILKTLFFELTKK